MKPFRFFLFTLLAALASCSDGIEDVAPAITSYTGLALAVPQVTVSSASKTMNATEAECTANDLYLFCFPQKNEKGEEKGVKLTQELTGLTAQTDLNGDASLYNIILQPGTYHVYVVANMGDKSIGTDDNGNTKLFKDNYSSLTEDNLKDLTLSYAAATLPTAGHIPMVYASGKDVVVYDGKATEVAANLTFTCAKVVVNIIFDPDNTDTKITAQQPKAAEVFKNNINWLLTGISGKNVTTSTNLFTASPSSESDAMTPLPGTGSFYDGYDYNEANQDVTNADVVTPTGDAVTTPTNARKWLYRATYYLPERSVTEAADATALPVTGKIIGKGGEYPNTYNNISGKNLYPLANGTYKLERGHYYEIVSFVNGLGQYDLPTKVEVKDWSTVNISADFLHTTLQVDKTAASIGSLTKDSVNYTTNSLEDISTGCDTKVGDNAVVSIAEKTHDGKKYLVFSINPAISMETFKEKGATTGTAKVWIQAGNIKKYIDVNYNVTPFLTVTPQQQIIYWTKAGDLTLIKKLTFKTNLGGIKFQSSDFQTFNGDATGGSHTYGNSKITVNCTSNAVASGTITVTADTDPVTTTEHTFKVLPLTSGYDDKAQEVKVTVKPAKGNYRIYMRAINDRQWFNGGTSSNEWAGILDEDYNSTGTTNVNNWEDGWFAKPNVTWPKDASPEYHYAYIYTQIGETKTPSDKDKMPAWIFTSGTYTWTNDDKNQPIYTHWPGDKMTADGNNPGWYYIDEAVNKHSVYKENTGDSGDKVITPGQTLIMFSNNTYQKEGRTLHRFNHHLEPGIPLFNFDDNEGWYLYDPLTDPYYRIFDDKPEIEDITYVIYTKYYVQGWYHKYGVANDTTTPEEGDMYTVWDNTLDREGPTNGWYKTTLKFKCAKGFYEKAITLCLGGSSALNPAYRVLLLNGASWTPSGKTITGYYDGSWHPGEPPKSGAAKRRR